MPLFTQVDFDPTTTTPCSHANGEPWSNIREQDPEMRGKRVINISIYYIHPLACSVKAVLGLLLVAMSQGLVLCVPR